MIYLLLTIITSVLIIISFKVFQILKINSLEAISVNYIVGFTYGSIFTASETDLSSTIKESWFWPAIFIGIVFIIGFFLFSRSTQKAGVSITAVSAKMSVLIPVIAGFIFFDDSISPIKIVGILLAIFSFYLIFKTDSKADLKYILLPLLLFLVAGLNDSLMKYVEHTFLEGDPLHFLSIVFLSAFFIGIASLVLLPNQSIKSISLYSIIGGFVLGSFNFWNAWALMKSMTVYESSMLFPIVNVSVVSISALSGAIIFKEKLSFINWLGISLALVAILLISYSSAG